MNTLEVTQVLKRLGWVVFTDEVGEKFTHFKLPDRTVQIIYGVRIIGKQQQLEATRSLSTEEFSSICAEISGKHSSYTPMIRAWKGFRAKWPEVLDEHVMQMSEETISWAKEQDLDKALLEYSNLPTDAPGARPIWHLASLVMLGDTSTLTSYHTSFMSGDRLGFVNYVTKDYIERSLAMARANRA